jgi:hypothetical protein
MAQTNVVVADDIELGLHVLVNLSCEVVYFQLLVIGILQPPPE